jgi:DNA-binding MarR family transcriptional regulator
MDLYEISKKLKVDIKLVYSEAKKLEKKDIIKR